MILESTARKMGVRFFKEHKLPKLAKMVDDYLCVDSVFEVAAKSLGKKKLKQLYLALPKSLKIYFLFYFNGYNEFRLEQSIGRIWEKFPDVPTEGRPERRKDGQELIKEMDEALQRYFAR